MEVKSEPLVRMHYKSVTAADHETADAVTEGRPTHIPENSAFLS